MSTPPNPTSLSTSTTVSTASTNPKERLKKSFRVILISLTFDVILGSCTVIWNYLSLFTDAIPIQFFDLFAHGELLIISVAITAGAIGTLLSSGKVSKDDTRSLFFFCLSLLILVFTAGWFTSLGPAGKASNIQGFGQISLALYVVSIIISVNCRLLAEA